jgi:hypothetical protein
MRTQEGEAITEWNDKIEEVALAHPSLDSLKTDDLASVASELYSLDLNLRALTVLNRIPRDQMPPVARRLRARILLEEGFDSVARLEYSQLPDSALSNADRWTRLSEGFQSAALSQVMADTASAFRMAIMRNAVNLGEVQLTTGRPREALATLLGTLDSGVKLGDSRYQLLTRAALQSNQNGLARYFLAHRRYSARQSEIDTLMAWAPGPEVQPRGLTVEWRRQELTFRHSFEVPCPLGAGTRMVPLSTPDSIRDLRVTSNGAAIQGRKFSKFGKTGILELDPAVLCPDATPAELVVTYQAPHHVSDSDPGGSNIYRLALLNEINLKTASPFVVDWENTRQRNDGWNASISEARTNLVLSNDRAGGVAVVALEVWSWPRIVYDSNFVFLIISAFTILHLLTIGLLFVRPVLAVRLVGAFIVVVTVYWLLNTFTKSFHPAITQVRRSLELLIGPESGVAPGLLAIVLGSITLLCLGISIALLHRYLLTTSNIPIFVKTFLYDLAPAILGTVLLSTFWENFTALGWNWVATVQLLLGLILFGLAIITIGNRTAWLLYIGGMAFGLVAGEWPGFRYVGAGGIVIFWLIPALVAARTRQVVPSSETLGGTIRVLESSLDRWFSEHSGVLKLAGLVAAAATFFASMSAMLER